MIYRGGVVRERPEVEARLLARQIPPEARIVALAFAAGDAERAARAAEAVAAGLGRRREHTLLASCEAAPSVLDRLLGGAESPGLWRAIRGEARLTEVAVRPRERLYVYLPAGPELSTPDALAEDERFAAFVDRARERGGTLLLFAPERLLSRPDFRILLDGYIALGRLEALPSDPGGPYEVARLDFGPAEEPGSLADGIPAEAEEPVAGAEEPVAGAEEPVAGAEEPVADAGEMLAVDVGEPAPDAGDPAPAAATAADATSERSRADAEALSEAPASAEGRPGGRKEPLPGEWPGAWRQHRERRRLPVVHAILGLLVVAILGAGWWAFAREAASPAPFGAEPTSAADGAPPISADALEAAVEEAPEVPFSVLIASYAAADDASARLARLQRAGGGLFFVAPTPVRGAIYHRVFAGALADAVAGRALMEELVRTGRKDEASAWDVRPARLAFRIAVLASEAEARTAAEQLEAEGVPVYVLSAGVPGPETDAPGPTPGASRRAADESGPSDGEREVEAQRAWLVYAGAYETEAAAGPLAALLERAGVRAELVVRRGEAR